MAEIIRFNDFRDYVKLNQEFTTAIPFFIIIWKTQLIEFSREKVECRSFTNFSTLLMTIVLWQFY